MAKKKDANGSAKSSHVTEGEVSKNYTLEAISNAINGGFEDLYQLDVDIAAAIERHVEPLKKARTKKWRNLKGDTGIDRQILTLKYKEFKFARDQQDNEDTGADKLDDLKTVARAMAAKFEDLGIAVGGQMTLDQADPDGDGFHDPDPDPAEAA